MNETPEIPPPPPFTAEQARELERFLRMPHRVGVGLGYFEAAALIYACCCSPVAIDPDECITLIIGDEAAGFGSAENRARVRDLVAALYLYIAYEMAHDRSALPPGCTLQREPIENLGSDTPLGRWARGFFEAHWTGDVEEGELPEDLERELSRTFYLLIFFAGRPNAERSRKGLGLPGGSLKGAACEVLEMIPAALRAYAAIGRSLKLARIEDEHEANAAERAAGRRARPHPRARPRREREPKD